MTATTSHFEEIKLIVYDLDGTLVDAFEDIWRGVCHAMVKFGLPEPSFDTVKSHVGDGSRMLIRRTLGDAEAKWLDEVHSAYRTYYRQHPVEKSRLYPGVLETLQRVRERGCRQAILTNKPDDVADSVCRRLGLLDRVDGIWGEQNGRPRKPDAEALNQVVRHFGVQARQSVMVGDGPADFKVARAAKTGLIAVTHGLLSRERIGRFEPDLRPDAIIDELPQLLEVLAF